MVIWSHRQYTHLGSLQWVQKTSPALIWRPYLYAQASPGLFKPSLSPRRLSWPPFAGPSTSPDGEFQHRIFYLSTIRPQIREWLKESEVLIFLVILYNLSYRRRVESFYFINNIHSWRIFVCVPTTLVC